MLSPQCALYILFFWGCFVHFHDIKIVGGTYGYRQVDRLGEVEHIGSVGR